MVVWNQKMEAMHEPSIAPPKYLELDNEDMTSMVEWENERLRK